MLCTEKANSSVIIRSASVPLDDSCRSVCASCMVVASLVPRPETATVSGLGTRLGSCLCDSLAPLMKLEAVINIVVDYSVLATMQIQNCRCGCYNTTCTVARHSVFVTATKIAMFQFRGCGFVEGIPPTVANHSCVHNSIIDPGLVHCYYACLRC